MNKKDNKKRKGSRVEISFHLQKIANFPYYISAAMGQQFLCSTRCEANTPTDTKTTWREYDKSIFVINSKMYNSDPIGYIRRYKSFGNRFSSSRSHTII